MFNLNPDDADEDGFSDGTESYLGTNAADDCPANTGANNENPDAWPPDMNDSQLVNIQDVGAYNGHIGQSA